MGAMINSYKSIGTFNIQKWLKFNKDLITSILYFCQTNFKDYHPSYKHFNNRKITLLNFKLSKYINIKKKKKCLLNKVLYYNLREGGFSFKNQKFASTQGISKQYNIFNNLKTCSLNNNIKISKKQNLYCY